jgi:hypothetical protein
MDTTAAVLFACAALYAVAGLAFALAFVISGVTVVQGAPVTFGARVLIFPRRRAVAAAARTLAQLSGRSMRRTHRTVHRLLWPALTLAVGFGLVFALMLRPPPEVSPPEVPAASERAP